MKNKNDGCVTNNDIQSHVEINDNDSDDEAMLINYEASDNEEPSFSETLEKMNSDIDIYSTSCAKNKNVFNLSPNPLSEVNSLSMGIPFEANIGPMQLQKAQIF